MPEMPQVSAATLAEKMHMGRVAMMGCAVCNNVCQIHHTRGGSMGIVGAGRRNSHWLTIGLCLDHHTGANGIHTIGVRTWERLYGTQADHLDYIADVLGVKVWELAKSEPRKSKGNTSASSKTVPHPASL